MASFYLVSWYAWLDECARNVMLAVGTRITCSGCRLVLPTEVPFEEVSLDCSKAHRVSCISHRGEHTGG